MKKIILINCLIFLSIIKAFAQPANDGCAGAQSVTPDGTCVAGTTVDATDGWTGSVGCQSGASHPEVWYSFVSTGTQASFTITNGTMTGNIELVLVESSGPCAGLALTGSSCGASPLSASFNGLVIGTTYYYTISSSTSSLGTFTTCVTTSNPPPVSGQDCGNAAILCNNNPFSQGTSSAGAGAVFGNASNENLSALGCLASDERQSKWYKFTIGCTGTIEFLVDPNDNANDYDWAVYDITTSGCALTPGGAAAGGATQVACNYSGCPGNTGILNPLTDPCTITNYTTCEAAGGPGNCSGADIGQFSIAPPTLTAGHTYALIIDNFSLSNAGFAFSWLSGGTATIGPDANYTYANPSCGVFNFTKSCATINSTFLWTFGDGGTSTLQNPSHTYVTGGTYIISLQVTDALGCINTSSQTVAFLTPLATATPASQSICSGTSTSIALSSTVIGTTYAWTVSETGVSGASAGSGSSIAQTLTLTGAVAGTATYTITPTAAGCVGATITVTITVNPSATIVLSSAVGTNAQTVCALAAIANITYTVGGAGTGAGVTGLPAGVTGAFAGTTFTISGTPTATGTFNYVVTTTGTCTQATATGTIIVNPNATITLTSAAATTAQTLCVSTAITNITYTVGGGGTGAGVTGLPAGVTGSFAGGVFTISGTPTATGTFNYTVTTTGSCTQATALGTITVNPNASITLTSAVGSNAQTICLTSPVTTITYTVGGGGTGAGVTGLPAGVSGSFAGSTFTISGTPTATGTFNYVVTTTGTCTQVTALGTIIVNPNATITLTSAIATTAQTLCVSTAITNITYTIGGGGTGAGVTGLPAGVTGSYAGGIFTISGTPTATGTFNYTVTTTGTCTQATALGTITVTPNATITLTSAVGTNAQTICLTSPVTTITYTVGGGGTGAGVTGLPAGVTGSFAGSTFTISGTPTATGTFNYVVTTTGTCTQVTALGTIIVNPNATITLTSAIATTAQTLCVSTAITTITYSIGGSGTGAGVTGLPAGVTGSFAGGVFTISGTPTASGTFNYTVTTTGTCTQATATGSITVNPLPAITSIPFTNETTCGASDGTITINATGTGLTYSINGGTSFVGTNLFTGLAAGSYTIVVENAAGCTVNGGVISISSAGAPATPAANAAPNPLCEGSALTLTVVAPVGGVTYNWSGPGGYSATGSSVSIPGVTTAMTGVYTVTGSIGSCVSPGGSVTVTVDPNAAIALTSAVGTDIQTWCLTNTITTISYTITDGGTGAGVTGLPIGVTGSYAGGIFTISGTPTETGTFNYTVTTTGTCTQAVASGTITINPNAIITLTSAAGTDSQIECINTAITAITYSVTGGGAGAGVTGLPTGVTGSFAGSIFTISGIPTATGTFNYTVTTTGTCTQTTATGSIIVNPDAAITLTSAVGTDAQTWCLTDAVTTITYSITGGGTGAGITGLPAGVTGSFSGGVFTISGTPTVTGVFNYLVTTTGSCTQASATGSITINSNAIITLTSVAGSDIQTSCINVAITPITYSVSGGGAGAGVTGLPAGVAGSFSGGIFTISGTPTATGIFNYTVTTTGTCTQTTATGTINVNPDAIIALTSAVGTEAQTVCINIPITTITYSVTGGGTGAGVTGLPIGITGSFAGGVFTIFGTPTASGTFNYSVTTTGTCSQATALGTIIVDSDAAIALTSVAGTDAQTACINTAITSITYSITGSGTNAGVTGLPAGVTGSLAAGVFTINGTPTATGTFNYTITTTGTCIQTTVLGSMVINPDAVIALTSAAGTNSQTLCINTAISVITYSITDGGTGAGVTGLPAGVTGSFAAGVFTISGTPSTSGTFNYTVTTTGTCLQATATGSIIINALPIIDTTNIVITPATCGLSDGSITGITASGATVLAYTWNGAASATTDLINVPVGAYTLVAMDINNCSSSMGPVQIINPGAPAAPAAPSPAAYCQGAAIADLTATGTGGTLTWYADAGLIAQVGTGSPFTTGVTSTSTFYVTETVSGCQSSATVVTITVNPPPSAPTAPSPASYCQGDTIADLTATGTGGTFTWYSDAGLITQVGTGSPFASGATSTGTFYVTETVSGCQSAATTVTITVNPPPSAPTAPSPSAYCQGTAIADLTASGTGGTFTWYSNPGLTTQVGTGSPFASGATNTTTFYVTETLGGCQGPATAVTVTFTPAPLAPTAPSPAAYCQGAAIADLTATGTGGTFTWYSDSGLTTQVGTGSPFASGATSTGTFYVTETITGCQSLATAVTITVNSPPSSPTAPSPAAYCQGDAIANLTATGTGGTFTWYSNPGLTTQVGTGSSFASGATSTSIFYVTQTISGCPSSATAVTITINNIPTTPTAGSNSPICEGSALNLTSDTVTGATYSWTGPNGFNSPAEDPVVSTSATVAMSGTYSVTVTVAGCTSLAGTTSVIVNPLPIASAGVDAMILSGSSITLTASGGGSYLWSTGDTDTTITVSPTVTTDYCVTVMDVNSCSDSDCVRVIVEIPCGTLFVPLAFSPNGDNENDVLSVYGDCITYLEFVIFDRWGEKVFETSDQTISWDGTYKGKKLDTAVFVYYLKATVKGESINKHGNITLTK
ncbi:MAG: hypothetical protein A3F72_12220 [Bacteroidetes bacterium RIFCSPLOWO2_12_FULL_35_15]|nr:MAG: hypothetical protein A3F72_12220 [Bacteroidetes bacterium RIFCSPLOWO2_12_FULL_35_15]